MGGCARLLKQSNVSSQVYECGRYSSPQSYDAVVGTGNFNPVSRLGNAALLLRLFRYFREVSPPITKKGGATVPLCGSNCRLSRW